jgi:DHA1 family tetracycline resistance protein-like MFS transporter
LVYLRLSDHFDSAQLGAFGSLVGLGYGFGLLVLMPCMRRYFQLKTIALWSGVLMTLGEGIAAICSDLWVQWVLAFGIAAVDIMLFTSMWVFFSNTVSKARQGWVMGVGNAVMGLAWVCSGLSANLLGLLGANGLMRLGVLMACISVACLFFFFVRVSGGDAQLNA